MKVGDRVVCISNHDYWENSNGCVNLGPIKDEILPIIRIDSDGGLVFNKYDQNEGYNPKCFRKIEPNFTNALTRKLAEDFIEEDNKVIETERERVLNLNAEF